jgi:hypothetical protein
MKIQTCTRFIPVVALAACMFGCDEPAPNTDAPSATAQPTAAETTPPTKPASTPTPTAAVKKPSHPCPDGSEGDGTMDKPCKAKGAARIMDVKWTGKISDKGPSFRVTNKAKLEILYGNIFVYFYDKAGKQLEIDGGEKKHKRVGCGGDIFAGPMKPGETATLWFSCVKKDDVPEGTASIEAELKTVGFTGDDGKADTFWRNDDLVPEERPKGGVK